MKSLIINNLKVSRDKKIIVMIVQPLDVNKVLKNVYKCFQIRCFSAV